MPTSTTTSNSPCRNSGFTFLELLVVVTMVAILTGTVVLGFAGADVQQETKGIAQRFAYRVELARQQALQRNREWGVFVEERGYRFAEFNPELAEWVERGAPFSHPTLPGYLTLELETEGLGELPFADGEDLPQLLVFSSGEITPFTMMFVLEQSEASWQVQSDGLSRARAMTDNEAT